MWTIAILIAAAFAALIATFYRGPNPAPAPFYGKFHFGWFSIFLLILSELVRAWPSGSH